MGGGGWFTAYAVRRRFAFSRRRYIGKKSDDRLTLIADLNNIPIFGSDSQLCEGRGAIGSWRTPVAAIFFPTPIHRKRSRPSADADCPYKKYTDSRVLFTALRGGEAIG